MASALAEIKSAGSMNATAALVVDLNVKRVAIEFNELNIQYLKQRPCRRCGLDSIGNFAEVWVGEPGPGVQVSKI